MLMLSLNGKTNHSGLGMEACCDNRRFGVLRRSWRIDDRSPESSGLARSGDLQIANSCNDAIRYLKFKLFMMCCMCYCIE